MTAAPTIYSALYYARDAADSHAEFVDAVFRCPPPLPAEEQKKAFGTVLGDALAEACSFDVVQSVHGGLVEMIEEHKVNKEVEPLQISKTTVRSMLTACGVPAKTCSASRRSTTRSSAQARRSARATSSRHGGSRSQRRT